jgi:hypothetical protein
MLIRLERDLGDVRYHGTDGQMLRRRSVGIIVAWAMSIEVWQLNAGEKTERWSRMDYLHCGLHTSTCDPVTVKQKPASPSSRCDLRIDFVPA